MMREWIHLRACILKFENDAPGWAGVALPDGRLIFAEPNSGRSPTLSTYSSEADALYHNPGARLDWHPDVDETVNTIGEVDL